MGAGFASHSSFSSPPSSSPSAYICFSSSQANSRVRRIMSLRSIMNAPPNTWQVGSSPRSKISCKSLFTSATMLTRTKRMSGWQYQSGRLLTRSIRPWIFCSKVGLNFSSLMMEVGSLKKFSNLFLLMSCFR